MPALDELRDELAALAPRTTWSAADWASHTATLHVRLAHLCQALRDGGGPCTPTVHGPAASTSIDPDRDWDGLVQWSAVAARELKGLILLARSHQARARALIRFDDARRRLIGVIDRLGQAHDRDFGTARPLPAARTRPPHRVASHRLGRSVR